MKSYLSLIKISEKVYKHKDKMTILCIIFAVFLVTSIFSMADMGVSMEKARIISKHGEEAIENIMLSDSIKSLYLIAGILFILVLLSGILMISGSLNSNIAKRTKFFGMLRSIGMTKKQTIKFVRLEALNLCKMAIPIGVALGILTSILLATGLKYKVGGEFAYIPIFKVSFIGIISGTLMGLLSVIISSSIPAKKASEVSPIAAISGRDFNKPIKLKNNILRRIKIENIMGVNNAVLQKKNYILITTSFALSIILFLTFSVLIDFIGFIMPQLSNVEDYSIYSPDGINEIPKELVLELKGLESIENIYSRQNTSLKYELEDGFTDELDLISYDEFDINSLKKDGLLEKNSNITELISDKNNIIITPFEKNSLYIGDSLKIGDKRLKIVGKLKYNIFKSDDLEDERLNVITSHETFRELTNINDYSLVLLQTKNPLNSVDLDKIKSIIGDKYILKDNIEQNTSSVYLAFTLFVYGFLLIIAIVSLLNIVNIIYLSVESKMKEYGIMRAVGMSHKQLVKMITVEAFTYSISGCILGSVIGVLINKKIFYILITNHFDYARWVVPYKQMIIVILYILISTLISIYRPVKQIKQISITDNINTI